MAELPDRRNCAAHDIHAAMMRTNADYARARTARSRRRLPHGRLGPPAGPTTIPVVVHVLHRGGPENISDDQIKSQIDVLNADFRKKNADIASVPAPFKPLAADAMIEFALASWDPNGRPTNGITRTRTSVPEFAADNAMKFTSQGGHDAWDTTRYLNIWVCPEIMDGRVRCSVMRSSQEGFRRPTGWLSSTTRSARRARRAAPFNRGRTATHEVGHWLDLYHIWGDPVGCSTDDQVADTPVQDRENFGAPAFPHISCGNAPMATCS